MDKSNTTEATSGAGTTYLLEHLYSAPVFSGVRIVQSLVFYRPLFVFVPFLLFLSLCCLSVFELRFRITHLVSQNVSLIISFLTSTS